MPGLVLRSPFHTCLASGSGMFRNWMGCDHSLHFRNCSSRARPQRLSLPFFLGGRGYKTRKVWVFLSFVLETRTRFRSLTLVLSPCLFGFSKYRKKKISWRNLFFCIMHQICSVCWLKCLVGEREGSRGHFHLVFWNLHFSCPPSLILAMPFQACRGRTLPWRVPYYFFEYSKNDFPHFAGVLGGF